MAGQGVSRMLAFKPIPERPTMTNRDPISPDAVLVAIDIAKVRNEVLIEAPHISDGGVCPFSTRVPSMTA